MSSIKLIRSNIFPFIKEGEILGLKEKIKELDSSLVKGTCLGSSMTGWLNISSIIDKETIKDIKDTAEKIRNDFEAFIIIGIGGSYLGARAIIDFCKKDKEAPEIYFAGQNLSTDTLSELIEIIKTKKTALAVISKSGTTTEPAIAFRILKDELEKNVGKEESKKSIFIVTDKNDGLLRVIAEKEGYKTFSVPGNIGGRYCVLTAVGLFPASVAGADIEKILEGAKIGEEKYSSPDLRENPSYQYAATRNALYRKGKSIEILGFFSPYLSNTSEWWKQLTGESEGKKQRGIYPASASFSTDLHSLGQLIQEGERNIFETFLFIESSLNEVKVPTTKEDIGKSVV